MAIAASLLRSEMRRHLLMNVTLVASCVVGGTVVTNERGLFVPLTHGMSETARAFAAMFTQSHLLPETNLTDVRMVSPLSPFEVTADSRDLRRRLMDSLSWLPEQASEYNKELAQISDQTLTPTEVASNNVPVNSFGTPAPASGNNGGSSTTPSSTTTTPTTPTTTTPTAPTSSPLVNNPTDPLPSSQQLANPDLTPDQANTVQNSNPTPTAPADSGGDVGAVPEPSSWAMLIAGFGLVGYFLRASRRRREVAAEATS